MPSKRNSKIGPNQEKEQLSNLVWSDNKIELLLRVVQPFATDKEFKGVKWESVKSKYDDIRASMMI